MPRAAPAAPTARIDQRTATGSVFCSVSGAWSEIATGRTPPLPDLPSFSPLAAALTLVAAALILWLRLPLLLALAAMALLGAGTGMLT